MRHPVVLLLVIALTAACRGGNTAAAAQRTSEIRTLENVDTKPSVIDPPPMLSDEAAAPKPRDPIALENMVPLTDADEQVRSKLPFAPAIAMDPVDGSKVSIRATTPMLELKGKIYYFSSEETKREFTANPDQFTKGLFSQL